jgi:hypothetical protein
MFVTSANLYDRLEVTRLEANKLSPGQVWDDLLTLPINSQRLKWRSCLRRMQQRPREWLDRETERFEHHGVSGMQSGGNS